MLRIRIRDPVPFNPSWIWVKILNFFDADPGSELEKIRIKYAGSGTEKIRIRDKHPGSASLPTIHILKTFQC
jgi:hypothetical protein